MDFRRFGIDFVIFRATCVGFGVFRCFLDWVGFYCFSGDFLWFGALLVASMGGF